MLKLGIIGCPLGHSLSPLMHNAALRELGIEGSYVILETPPEKLSERIFFLKGAEFRGFNVTIPHKVAIMQFLDSIDDFAKTVGAVNTVVIDENKKLHGYNTDVYGFIQAIPTEWQKNFIGNQAAVLGCGGAARAVLAGLIEMGIQKISIFARNQEKSQELKEIFANIEINCQNLTENIDLSAFSIVVNTTPLGMQGANQEISPLNQESIATLPQSAIVYDIVYKPKKTKLLEYAEKRDLKAINGLEMLILQGAKGFELWTGQKPPVEIMRRKILF